MRKLLYIFSFSIILNILSCNYQSNLTSKESSKITLKVNIPKNENITKAYPTNYAVKVFVNGVDLEHPIVYEKYGLSPGNVTITLNIPSPGRRYLSVVIEGNYSSTLFPLYYGDISFYISPTESKTLNLTLRKTFWEVGESYHFYISTEFSYGNRYFISRNGNYTSYPINTPENSTYLLYHVLNDAFLDVLINGKNVLETNIYGDKQDKITFKAYYFQSLDGWMDISFPYIYVSSYSTLPSLSYYGIKDIYEKLKNMSSEFENISYMNYDSYNFYAQRNFLDIYNSYIIGNKLYAGSLGIGSEGNSLEGENKFFTYIINSYSFNGSYIGFIKQKFSSLFSTDASLGDTENLLNSTLSVSLNENGYKEIALFPYFADQHNLAYPLPITQNIPSSIKFSSNIKTLGVVYRKIYESASNMVVEDAKRIFYSPSSTESSISLAETEDFNFPSDKNFYFVGVKENHSTEYSQDFDYRKVYNFNYFTKYINSLGALSLPSTGFTYKKRSDTLDKTLIVLDSNGIYHIKIYPSSNVEKNVALDSIKITLNQHYYPSLDLTKFEFILENDTLPLKTCSLTIGYGEKHAFGNPLSDYFIYNKILINNITTYADYPPNKLFFIENFTKYNNPNYDVYAILKCSNFDENYEILKIYKVENNLLKDIYNFTLTKFNEVNLNYIVDSNYTTITIYPSNFNNTLIYVEDAYVDTAGSTIKDNKFIHTYLNANLTYNITKDFDKLISQNNMTYKDMFFISYLDQKRAYYTIHYNKTSNVTVNYDTSTNSATLDYGSDISYDALILWKPKVSSSKILMKRVNSLTNPSGEVTLTSSDLDLTTSGDYTYAIALTVKPWDYDTSKPEIVYKVFKIVYP